MNVSIALLLIGIPGSRWDIEWLPFLLALLVPVCLVTVAHYRIRSQR